jgi:hypothetical protein
VKLHFKHAQVTGHTQTEQRIMWSQYVRGCCKKTSLSKLIIENGTQWYSLLQSVGHNVERPPTLHNGTHREAEDMLLVAKV